MTTDALQALREKWLQEAETLERYADNRGAALLRVCASELEEAQRTAGKQLLTLAEASKESGYSVDHLRHLLSDEVVPNAGRKGSPRIKRVDLPMKPGARDSDGFDAAAVAGEILRGVS